MLKKSISIIAFSITAGLFMTSCGGDAESTKKVEERVYIKGDIAKGAEMFKTNCTACHQADGKGKAGFAPNINNIDFLSIADDALIKSFILEGRAGTSMMSYKNMPNVADNIDDLVAYMRSWEKEFELAKITPVDKTWKSAGDATNGKELFKSYCLYCHGATGEGYASGGAGTAIGNPAFLALVSDDYIKQTMILGRNGTAMKSFAGAKGVANMSDSDMDDVITYLRTLEKK